MIRLAAILIPLLLLSGPTVAEELRPSMRLTVDELREMMLTKASYSCGRRKYCSRNISSCDEAYWYLHNCSWGHQLDSDGDGVPCENLCSKRRRR